MTKKTFILSLGVTAFLLSAGMAAAEPPKIQPDARAAVTPANKNLQILLLSASMKPVAAAAHPE